MVATSVKAIEIAVFIFSVPLASSRPKNGPRKLRITNERRRVSNVPTTRQETALAIERAGLISGGLGGSKRGSSGPKIGFSGFSLMSNFLQGFLSSSLSLTRNLCAYLYVAVFDGCHSYTVGSFVVIIHLSLLGDC